MENRGKFHSSEYIAGKSMIIRPQIRTRSQGVGREPSRGDGRLTLMLPQWLALVVFLLLSSFTGGGSGPVPRPTRQVTVHPGDDIGRLVEQNQPGTEFRIQPGVYRLQLITPKEGDS